MECRRQSPGFDVFRRRLPRFCCWSSPSKNYTFIYDMRNAAYTFAEQLKPDDYVAVMTFDMRTQILTDFTQDKRVIYQSLNY